jgi:hypothetical protein
MMMVTVVAVSACTTGPPPPPVSPTPERTPSAGALGCGDAIDTLTTAPDDLTVVLGVVALPTGFMLQSSASGESDPAARLFAKQGLVVKLGTVVDLSIGTAALGHARIAWGNPGVIADHARAEAFGCPGVFPSYWIAFAGGYYVDEPRCLPIVVEFAGTRDTVSVPVGAPCP